MPGARPVIILGIDPGFRALGWALYDGVQGCCLDLGVVQTEASHRKREVSAQDDDTRCCRELGRAVRILMAKANMLAAETCAHPRGIRALYTSGLAWGVVATEADHARLPVVQSSPQEVRKRI